MHLGQSEPEVLPVHDSNYPLDCLPLFIKAFGRAGVQEAHYRIESAVTEVTAHQGTPDLVGTLEYDEVVAPIVEGVIKQSDFLRAIAYGVENVLRNMDPATPSFDCARLKEAIRAESGKLLHKRRSMWHIIEEGLNRLLAPGQQSRVILQGTGYVPKMRVCYYQNHTMHPASTSAVATKRLCLVFRRILVMCAERFAGQMW